MSLSSLVRFGAEDPALWLDRRSRRLGNEKDLPGIGILHFRSRRKAFDVDIFSGREGTFHQVFLPGHRNSIWEIAFRHLCRSSGGRRPRGSLLARRRIGLNRPIRIERLLLGRIILPWFLRITCGPMAPSWRRLLHITGGNEEQTKERKRERKFHNSQLDEGIWDLIRCQSLNLALHRKKRPTDGNHQNR